MRRSLNALALLGATAFLACSPSRPRPGPPRVNIVVENSSTITSPDTITVTVSAIDDDGLDSLNLQWGTLVFEFNTEFGVEATETVELPVPAGLPPGTRRDIFVVARDLFGQRTVEQETIRISQ